MSNKVLASVDHSTYAPAICDLAAWAALRLGAPLEFVHVLDRHPEVASTRDLSGSIGLGSQEALLKDLASLDEQRSRLAQESGRLLLEGVKHRAHEAGVAAPQSRQRHGELVETLAGMEEEVRLFVLGKRGEAAESAPQHVGSNLERVVRALHRPILIATQNFQPPRNVMIGFDGSATTRKGVEMIASSPLFRGLPCHLVMVGSESASTSAQLEWARNTLQDEGFEVHTAIQAGDAETVLATYVQEQRIDMLVMGAYGHSRIRQLLVGSTTTSMMRTTSVPLLLLR
jgi:nucleotide-binding universal stress UspA family protein